MLIECSRCGAPLDAKPDARSVRCAYCQASNELLRARKLSGATPEGWKPPDVWTPPAGAQHPSVQLRRRSASPLLAVALGLTTVLLIAGIVTATVLGGSSSRTTTLTVTGAADGELPAGAKGLVPEEALQLLGSAVPGVWDGRSTRECGVNQTVTIDGRVGGVEGGPVVRVTGPNCRVVLRGATLTGSPIVEAGTNTRVRIEGSRLTGARIVDGGLNVEIDVDGSVLEATEVAISTGHNTKIRLAGETTVQGGESAIVGGTNTEVHARGPVRIVGAEDGIRIEQNGVVKMRGGRVEAGERALAMARNADVELRDTRVVGREASLAFELNADVRLRDVTTEGERHLGRNLDIDERR